MDRETVATFGLLTGRSLPFVDVINNTTIKVFRQALALDEVRSGWHFSKCRLNVLHFLNSTARSFAQTCIAMGTLKNHRRDRCPKAEYSMNEGQMRYIRPMCQRCGSLGVTMVRF